MKTLELKLGRRNTRAYIDEDAVEVLIQRQAGTKDSRGGRSTAPSQFWLGPQRVRLIPARSRSSALTYTLPTGETLEAKDKLMIGPWDMDVQMGDQFTFRDMDYRVVFVEPDRQVETLCQLDLVGPTSRSTL